MTPENVVSYFERESQQNKQLNAVALSALTFDEWMTMVGGIIVGAGAELSNNVESTCVKGISTVITSSY